MWFFVGDTAVENQDIPLIHTLVDRKYPMDEVDESGQDAIKLANTIQDGPTRHSIMAALHDAPPNDENIMTKR